MLLLRSMASLSLIIFSIMELQELIPETELFKMTIRMLVLFWRGWSCCFGCLFLQYDSHHLYCMLHQGHPLSLVLIAH